MLKAFKRFYNMAKRIGAVTGTEHVQQLLDISSVEVLLRLWIVLYASAMGAKAVDILAAGGSKRIIGHMNGEFVDYDINEALEMKKTLDPFLWDVSQRLSKL